MHRLINRLSNRFIVGGAAVVIVTGLVAAVLVQSIAEAEPRATASTGSNSQSSSVSTGSWQIERDISRAVQQIEQDKAAELAHQFEQYVTSAQLQDFAAAVQADQDRQVAAAQAAQARQASAAQAPSAGDGGVWDQLAQCETGGRWATSSVPGYSGGLGFANSSWAAYGGQQYAPTAGQASREQQIAVAERIRASAGWGAWPACSSRLGLR